MIVMEDYYKQKDNREILQILGFGLVVKNQESSHICLFSRKIKRITSKVYFII